LLEKDAESIGEELQQKGTALYIALRLNSSQACLKQSNWTDAAEHANRVLLIDKENAKALYRRAAASVQFDTESRLEQARADLTRFVQLEPTNREAREMLQQSKERLKEAKQREKERYAVAMQGGLYQENHRKLDRQKLEYEEEVKRRAEAGEDEISWEDWQKKLKEKEDEGKKKEKEAREARAKELREEEEQRQLTEENARRVATGLEELTREEWQSLQKDEAKKDEVVQLAADDLDEEERKMLEETSKKGYYHGRLGTVLSSDAPEPQKLAEGSREDVDKDASGKRRSSAWNEEAGTWEERDTSTWVQERLTDWLQNAHVSSSSVTLPSGEVAKVSGEISKVKKCSGTASIVFVREKKRPGYSFEADLSFRISVKRPKDSLAPAPEQDEETSTATDGAESKALQRFNGTLSLPELADFVPAKELKIDARWKGASPPDDLQQPVVECLDKLRASLREQVSGFIEEYKEH